MKLRKLFIIAAMLCAAFAIQTTAQSKTKKPKPKTKPAAPRTATDFYMILPAKYFPYVEGEKNRADLIGTSSENMVMFDNNRAFSPVNGQILLLRRMSGTMLLAISLTECGIGSCRDSLRFVEYKSGRWTEVDGAPPLNRPTMDILFEKKFGRAPDDDAYLIYDISAVDKSISVQLYSAPDKAEIYKLEWDGNIYDFAAPNE